MGQAQTKSDETPEPGDLIAFSRRAYFHWAVYVGDDYVVHVTLPPGDEVSASSSLRSAPNEKAMVRKQKLEEVAGDSKWGISNILDKMCKPRSPHIIVEEALRQVGKRMEYSVTRKNCEHFATKLRYGKAVSLQGLMVDAAVDAVAAPVHRPGGFYMALAKAAVELRRPPTD